MVETAAQFIAEESSRTTSGYSNKDVINRVQIFRFEECVERMYEDGSIFRQKLMQLYWSYVVPRLSSIESKSQKGLMINLYNELNTPRKTGETPEQERGRLLKVFEEMAQFMYQEGALKTEYSKSDPYHAFIQKLADAKQVMK